MSGRQHQLRSALDFLGGMVMGGTGVVMQPNPKAGTEPVSSGNPTTTESSGGAAPPWAAGGGAGPAGGPGGYGGALPAQYLRPSPYSDEENYPASVACYSPSSIADPLGGPEIRFDGAGAPSADMYTQFGPAPHPSADGVGFISWDAIAGYMPWLIRFLIGAIVLSLGLVVLNVVAHILFWLVLTLGALATTLIAINFLNPEFSSKVATAVVPRLPARLRDFATKYNLVELDTDIQPKPMLQELRDVNVINRPFNLS